MTEIDDAYWNELDAKISATYLGHNENASREVIKSKQVADAGHASKDRVVRLVQPRSDWTNILNIIAEAKDTFDRQQVDLCGKASAHAALFLELKTSQEEVRTLKLALIETQANNAKLQAEADARMQAVRKSANAAVEEAYEFMRAAQIRADTAENWLRRVAQASSGLVSSEQRAVA